MSLMQASCVSDTWKRYNNSTLRLCKFLTQTFKPFSTLRGHANLCLLFLFAHLGDSDESVLMPFACTCFFFLLLFPPLIDVPG